LIKLARDDLTSSNPTGEKCTKQSSNEGTLYVFIVFIVIIKLETFELAQGINIPKMKQPKTGALIMPATLKPA